MREAKATVGCGGLPFCSFQDSFSRSQNTLSVLPKEEGKVMPGFMFRVMPGLCLEFNSSYK